MLKLVFSNRNSSLKLETDTLVESIFSFMTEYFGNNTKIEDIYVNSICLMETLCSSYGYPPSTNTYMFDLDLWENRINSSFFETIKKPIFIYNEAKRKIEGLERLYPTLAPKLEVQCLNKQEIFEYASYLFLEDFLKFLDYKDTMFNYPSINDRLKDNNLDNDLRTALEKPEDIIFLSNPMDTPYSVYTKR